MDRFVCRAKDDGKAWPRFKPAFVKVPVFSATVWLTAFSAGYSDL